MFINNLFKKLFKKTKNELSPAPTATPEVNSSKKDESTPIGNVDKQKKEPLIRPVVIEISPTKIKKSSETKPEVKLKNKKTITKTSVIKRLKK